MRAADSDPDLQELLDDPTIYTKLTGRRGWSHAQYVSWARDSLLKIVLEAPTPGAPPRP